MTSTRTSNKTRTRLWLETGALWLVLLVMFAVNFFLAYVPLGEMNIPAHMSIAGAMIVLLVLFFMDFKSYSPLLRMTALAGLFWLIFMFSLTAADYITRLH
jgi:cytochrome c oxidase subunit IV